MANARSYKELFHDIGQVVMKVMLFLSMVFRRD